MRGRWPGDQWWRLVIGGLALVVWLGAVWRQRQNIHNQLNPFASPLQNPACFSNGTSLVARLTL